MSVRVLSLEDLATIAICLSAWYGPDQACRELAPLHHATTVAFERRHPGAAPAPKPATADEIMRAVRRALGVRGRRPKRDTWGAICGRYASRPGVLDKARAAAFALVSDGRECMSTAARDTALGICMHMMLNHGA